jgi:hypothetical protein
MLGTCYAFGKLGKITINHYKITFLNFFEDNFIIKNKKTTQGKK